ncbi:hypothetical protein ACFXDO_16720 [Streptomyces nigra]|uniref:8-oxoguanine DNA glycosylase OGG fold protein n=1 Tax=Streptomyces nigra TaxID=1827580 RepID=UPI0036C3D569
MAPTCAGGDAAVSRAEVASTVADVLRREAFREALVAICVWGKGKRGTPGGSGLSTLHKILAFGGLDAALAAAVTALREHGAPQAYAALQGQVPGPGPALPCRPPADRGRSSSTACCPAVCGSWPLPSAG